MMNGYGAQFSSAHGRAQVVVVLLAVTIALHVINLFLNFYVVALFPGSAANSLIRLGEAANWPAAAEGFNALMIFLVYVATAVAFLMWLHRANRNLPALGMAHPEFTPGWAVGWFFVPFANLRMPYKVVQEVWVGSDPQLSVPGKEAWQQPDSSSLLGWWWGCWILSNIIAEVGARLSQNARTPGEFYTATKIEMSADALIMGAAVLAIMVVKGIDRRQDLRSRNLQQSYLPPPPPVFYTPQT